MERGKELYGLNVSAIAFQPTSTGAAAQIRKELMHRVPAPARWGVRVRNAMRISACSAAHGDPVIQAGGVERDAEPAVASFGFYIDIACATSILARPREAWVRQVTPPAGSQPS